MTLDELKLTIDLNPQISKTKLIANAAKENVRESRNAGYRAYDSQENTFTRPSVRRGYGAILFGLSKLPARLRRSQAMVTAMLFGPKPERWGNTAWQAAVAAKLCHKPGKTWELTPFGKFYVKEVLHALKR